MKKSFHKKASLNKIHGFFLYLLRLDNVLIAINIILKWKFCKLENIVILSLKIQKDASFKFCIDIVFTFISKFKMIHFYHHVNQKSKRV